MARRTKICVHSIPVARLKGKEASVQFQKKEVPKIKQIQTGQWIQIQYGSGSEQYCKPGKNDPQKYKTVKKFYV